MAVLLDLVEELTLSLDEEREQIRALKRKHASNVKDMQRQVQLQTKWVPNYAHIHAIPFRVNLPCACTRRACTVGV